MSKIPSPALVERFDCDGSSQQRHVVTLSRVQARDIGHGDSMLSAGKDLHGVARPFWRQPRVPQQSSVSTIGPQK